MTIRTLYPTNVQTGYDPGYGGAYSFEASSLGNVSDDSDETLTTLAADWDANNVYHVGSITVDFPAITDGFVPDALALQIRARANPDYVAQLADGAGCTFHTNHSFADGTPYFDWDTWSGSGGSTDASSEITSLVNGAITTPTWIEFRYYPTPSLVDPTDGNWQSVYDGSNPYLALTTTGYRLTIFVEPALQSTPPTSYFDIYEIRLLVSGAEPSRIGQLYVNLSQDQNVPSWVSVCGQEAFWLTYDTAGMDHYLLAGPDFTPVRVTDTGTGNLGSGFASSDECYLRGYRVSVDHTNSTRDVLLYELQKIDGTSVNLVDSTTAATYQFVGRQVTRLDDTRFLTVTRPPGVASTDFTTRFIVGDVSSGSLVLTTTDLSSVRYGSAEGRIALLSSTDLVVYTQSDYGAFTNWSGAWHQLTLNADNTISFVSQTVLWTGRSSQNFSLWVYGTANGYALVNTHDFTRANGVDYQYETRTHSGTMAWSLIEDIGNWTVSPWPYNNSDEVVLSVAKYGDGATIPTTMEIDRWTISTSGVGSRETIASFTSPGWPDWCGVTPLGGQRYAVAWWDDSYNDNISVFTANDWAGKTDISTPATADSGSMNDLFGGFASGALGNFNISEAALTDWRRIHYEASGSWCPVWANISTSGTPTWYTCCSHAP